MEEQRRMLVKKKVAYTKPRLYTHCLLCGAPLTGRSDKKYCRGHKNTFNNAKRKKRDLPASRLLKRFKSNDQVLEKLKEINGDNWIPSEVLAPMGFDGAIVGIKIKDDRIIGEGEQFIHYSIHFSTDRNFFKLLYHEG